MINPDSVSPEARFLNQKALMNKADAFADICDVMEASGQTIDDIVYAKSRAISWSGAQPPKLSSFAKVGNGVPIVSFFTGCGRMDLGFEAVGFKHKAAFKFNETFCKSLRVNRLLWRVFGPPCQNGDVSKTDEIIAQLSPVIQFHLKPFSSVARLVSRSPLRQINGSPNPAINLSALALHMRRTATFCLTLWRLSSISSLPALSLKTCRVCAT